MRSASLWAGLLAPNNEWIGKPAVSVLETKDGWWNLLGSKYFPGGWSEDQSVIGYAPSVAWGFGALRIEITRNIDTQYKEFVVTLSNCGSSL